MPDFPKKATPSEVWTYAARKLTGIDGQARTDIVGQDNSLEATTGTRVSKMDNLNATVSSRAVESGGRLDSIPAFVAATESSVVMDGTEKTLFEITDVKAGEVEAWVDLTTMQAGDTIVVRYSRKMKSGGTYAKYAEETYSDTQTMPALCLINKKIYRDTKVTAQQTAGTNRTLDVQVVRTREA